MIKMSVTPEKLRELGNAVKKIGGGRKFERFAGLSSGHVTRLMSGKIQSVSGETAGKIGWAINMVRTFDGPGGEPPWASNDCDVAEDDSDLMRTERLRGRVESALELIDAIGGCDDGIKEAVRIINNAVSELLVRR